jgi:DNA invertase Pin-like site-specific DNA recombinase
MLRERTRNGLEAARKQGRVGGRSPKLKTHQQQEILDLVNSGQKTAADAARLFNVHSVICISRTPIWTCDQQNQPKSHLF